MITNVRAKPLLPKPMRGTANGLYQHFAGCGVAVRQLRGVNRGLCGLCHVVCILRVVFFDGFGVGG
jgi:hypothetical protein